MAGDAASTGSGWLGLRSDSYCAGSTSPCSLKSRAMNDSESSPPDTPTPPRRRFQFSIESILLWTAIACLAISNVMLSRKLERITRDVQSSRPLSPNEVAEQFEKRTTLGPITTNVEDVRYSPEKDAFQIEFSWVDANTNEEWWSDVELQSDEFGRYYGRIRNGPFVKPLGYQDGFTIIVESPSSFERENGDQ